MEKEILYIQEVVNGFRSDVEVLMKYLPWLEVKAGDNISSLYKGEGIEETSMSFPVYDSTLLSMVQDIKKTNLLDRNYAYIYSRNRIKNVADEQKLIEKATIRDMDTLKGILSKYILGGMTKGTTWTEGIKNGSILKVVLKMKEIIEYWDKPINERETDIK